MLKRVHFAGIKSLQDVAVDLEPFTVLVGPNGCGKSTLLDQIEIICRASQVDPTVKGPFGKLGEVISSLPLEELQTLGAGKSMFWSGSRENSSQLTVEMKYETSPRQWYSGTTVSITIEDLQAEGGCSISPSAGRFSRWSVGLFALTALISGWLHRRRGGGGGR